MILSGSLLKSEKKKYEFSLNRTSNIYRRAEFAQNNSLFHLVFMAVFRVLQLY